MKMRPCRSAEAEAAVKRSGSSAAMSCARPLAKRSTAFQSACDEKTLAAGCLHEGRHVQRRKPVAHGKRGLAHGFHGDALVGIKVEGDVVRLAQRLNLRAPAVNFHGAELHQRGQTFEVADEEKLGTVGGIAHRMNRFGHAGPGMLLEEALAAVGGAHQDQRPLTTKALIRSQAAS